MNPYLRNIWTFYLFQIFRCLELSVSVFILYLLSNGLTMTQIMTIQAIFMITELILEVPSGAFADLYGRKTSLALGMLFSTVSYITYAIGSTYVVFLIANILMAFSVALRSGADSALLYDSLKEAKQEKKYGKIYSTSNGIALITYALSALASGFLGMYFAYRNIVYITAAIFFISFLITLLFKEPPIHKKRQKRYYEHLKEAFQFSYKHKIIRNLIIYYGMFAALGHLTWFVIQPYYDNSALPKYIIGVATFLYFISAGIGSISAQSFAKKMREEKFLMIILLMASICFITIFFTTEFLALALIAIMSFLCGIRDVFVNKGINRYTD